MKTDAAKRLGKPAPKARMRSRAVYVGFRGIRWSQPGQQLAFNLFSADNKDRWILDDEIWVVRIEAKWQLAHRLTDQAWVNDGSFNEFGWSPDGKAFMVSVGGVWL